MRVRLHLCMSLQGECPYRTRVCAIGDTEWLVLCVMMLMASALDEHRRPKLKLAPLQVGFLPGMGVCWWKSA